LVIEPARISSRCLYPHLRKKKKKKRKRGRKKKRNKRAAFQDDW